MANQRTTEFEQSNNAQVREVKTKLVHDYIENQKDLTNARPQQQSGSMSAVQGDQLVFSVLDDVRIYGSDALDLEFQTRQYDPYTLYKQKLNSQPGQNRTLNITVSESA